MGYLEFLVHILLKINHWVLLNFDIWTLVMYQTPLLIRTGSDRSKKRTNIGNGGRIRKNIGHQG